MRTGKRKLGKIVLDVQEGRPVPEKDVHLALLALYYKLHEHVQRQVTHEGRHTLQESPIWQEFSAFINGDPADYLGPEWTPGTPENEKMRRIAKATMQRRRDFDDEWLAKEVRRWMEQSRPKAPWM